MPFCFKNTQCEFSVVWFTAVDSVSDGVRSMSYSNEVKWNVQQPNHVKSQTEKNEYVYILVAGRRSFWIDNPVFVVYLMASTFCNLVEHTKFLIKFQCSSQHSAIKVLLFCSIRFGAVVQHKCNIGNGCFMC